MSRANLHDAMQDVEALRRALADAQIQIDDDDKVWRDAVEGQTDFVETVEKVLEAIEDDEAWANICKQRIAQLNARKIAMETRASKARKAVANALDVTGMSPMRQATFTISAGRRQIVDIYDPEQLPDDYRVTPMPKIDRQLIEKALREGRKVPGARLKEGDPFLTLRRAG